MHPWLFRPKSTFPAQPTASARYPFQHVSKVTCSFRLVIDKADVRM